MAGVPVAYLDILRIQRSLKRVAAVPVVGTLARIAMKVCNLVLGCSVPLDARIGAGSVCEHRGLGVVIHEEAVVGERVHILTGVVVGGRGRGVDGAPIIEDDVTLAPGAKVLGPVTVGRGSIVGANAVVLADVPPYSLAVGIPAVVRPLRPE